MGKDIIGNMGRQHADHAAGRLHGPHVPAGDERAFTLHPVQQPFLLQFPERLPHRLSAHIEAARDLILRRRLVVGLKLSRLDPGHQLLLQPYIFRYWFVRHFAPRYPAVNSIQVIIT
ncbi:hypothetical protein D3C71_1743300 [compost metagenome]